MRAPEVILLEPISHPLLPAFRSGRLAKHHRRPFESGDDDGVGRQDAGHRWKRAVGPQLTGDVIVLLASDVPQFLLDLLQVVDVVESRFFGIARRPHEHPIATDQKCKKFVSPRRSGTENDAGMGSVHAAKYAASTGDANAGVPPVKIFPRLRLAQGTHKNASARPLMNATAIIGEDTTITLPQRLAQRNRPAGRPAMYQTWEDLLFLHWQVDPALVQSRLPVGLRVDTFEDRAWVGVVPFFMRNIRPAWSPAVPGISNFQELNLRTYVVDERGTPGVWFFSLDADTRVGVWWGRTLYDLPYHYARMMHTRDRATGRVEYASQRPGTPARLASQFAYEPQGPAWTAQPGTLEFFLVERYLLFTQNRRGALMSGRVYHAPYEVHHATAQANDALFELNGLPRPGRAPDHMLISRGVDVEVFALQCAK